MVFLVSIFAAVCAALFYLNFKVRGRQKVVAEQLPSDGLSGCVERTYADEYVDADKEAALLRDYEDVYNAVVGALSQSRFVVFRNNPQLSEFRNDYEEIERIVGAHNDRFKIRKVDENARFFDTVLAYPLDRQQRLSIVSEEQNCLVVSSAGSGKTSSIVGKVEYLIQKKGVDPRRILLISYTRKAAEELTERMGHPGLNGYTFHKLALDMISEAKKQKPLICDNTDRIFRYIFKELSHNADYKKCLVKYFVDYSDFFELDADELSKRARKLQLGEAADRYKALFPDMDGKEVIVRSGQERKICTLLTSLGVQFRYEQPYEHSVADERHSQYRPDFSIYYEKGGQKCRLYLEHFGVDEHSMVPTWFAEDRGLTYDEANERYNDGITWKRDVHRKYGTTLIELSSADFEYHNERKRLVGQLEANGVEVRAVPDEELLEMIMPEEGRQEKVFIRLLATFVTLLKTSCKTIEEVQTEVARNGDGRSRFIVDKIMAPVAKRYSEILQSQNLNDFTDLIVEATAMCDSSEGGKYDCIIVDEFQDISVDRCNFLKALRRGNPPAQLYCVGDDWQSIYRFSGSDMNLFNHFNRCFGKTDVNKIETTYRFGNPLVKMSAEFVQRNPVQIRKNIHPYSATARTDIEFVDYTPIMFASQLEAIVAAVPEGKSVFLLGRYSYDDNLLNGKFRQIRRGSGLFYDVCGREVEFMTIHKSKGLEADYVVLLNCNNGNFGFPSTIADDPVLKYVMSDKEEYLFGEERRLFYVAVTRAKVKTVVMYHKYKPSVFVIECLHPERLTDKPLTPHRNANKRWNSTGDDMLRNMYSQGMGLREMSRRMGRSQTSIVMRLEKLGLIDSRKPIRKK